MLNVLLSVSIAGQPPFLVLRTLILEHVDWGLSPTLLQRRFSPSSCSDYDTSAKVLDVTEYGFYIPQDLTDLEG